MSCNCETGKFPIKIIQGDSYRRVYKFYDVDGNIIDNTNLATVYFTCARLNYSTSLNYSTDDEGWVLYFTSDTTKEFVYCKSDYDLTLYFTDRQISTQIYRSEFRVCEKKMFPVVEVSGEGEYVNVDDITTEVYTNIIVGNGGGIADHSILLNRNLPNQHSMSAITGLEDALDGKAGAEDIPTVNDGVLIIKQNGTFKGSFSANAAQNVEINLDGGGGGQGWTAEQITLLETVLANIVYIDQTTGQEAARQLIESLRGVVPSDYEITQVGNTLIISRAPATKSNDTLIIT